MNLKPAKLTTLTPLKMKGKDFNSQETTENNMSQVSNSIKEKRIVPKRNNVRKKMRKNKSSTSLKNRIGK